MSKQPQQQTIVNVTLAGGVGGAPLVPAKSLGAAIALWFVAGGFGAHRFYLGRPHAVTMLVLTLTGVVTAILIVGFFLLAAVGIWVIVDVFSLAAWVNESNARASGLLPAAGPQPEAQAIKPEPAELMTLLLREAERHGNQLTVKQGVLATGRTFNEVAECLNGMVDSGYVDVDNAKGSGVVIYVFGE